METRQIKEIKDVMNQKKMYSFRLKFFLDSEYNILLIVWMNSMVIYLDKLDFPLKSFKPINIRKSYDRSYF